ncbi:MAG TPA: hypothetical protein PK286_01170 [Devosia sp.]|nr:hypothetical protein [Devosia sp.]
MSTISVTIADRDELFTAPELDPFTDQLEILSGVERLLDQIEHLRSRPDGGTAEIRMPADQITPTIEHEIRAALIAYCRTRIIQAQRDLRITRRHGVHSLWIGLPILALCMGLSTAVSTAFGTGGFGSLLSNGLVIAGWVAMWNPAEALLYDWWPYRERIILLTTLSQMTVSVVPN